MLIGLTCFWKGNLMIHEIRTYTLHPRVTPEFLKRTAQKVQKRMEYSQLGGFFYTEIGALNQVVHIWPYEDLNHRSEVRKTVVEEGVWPPDNSELVVDQRSDILIPVPFMRSLEPKKYGPIYEMRIYTYQPGQIPGVISAWSEAIDEREKLSPLVGCWYSEIGELSTFIHLWAYSSLDERQKVRAEALATGIWPPRSGVTAPVTQENKIMLPADFSPLS